MIVRRIWPSRPTFDTGSADLDRVRRDIARLLEAAAGDTSVSAGVFPPLNLTQDDDNFYLRAEVPGVEPDELSISALRNRVTLSGKREIPTEENPVSYHRKERAEGAFSRTISIPIEVDTSRADAHFADGILTLTLPKAEAAKPRQITVKT